MILNVFQLIIKNTEKKYVREVCYENLNINLQKILYRKIF